MRIGDGDMNTERIGAFREKMGQGCVIGPFMKTCDPAFVEAAGYGGMDFAILDMEHGPVSLESLQNNIRAAQIAGLLPVVRVGSQEDIGRVLDIGAAGVQIPQVSTAREAEAAVGLAKFYPMGERGICRFVRAACYSALDRNVYFSRANQCLVIIQVEGMDGIRNLDEILEVPGIDIVFMGPYDLSQSLGVPGKIMHPLVIEQMRQIAKKAMGKGVLVGTFTDSRESMRLWSGLGVRYLAYSVDTGIFCDACGQVRRELEGMV